MSAISTSASEPGSATGSVRSRTALITWKMAVFAPMPSASDRTATTVKLGLRRSRRAAYCTSWRSRSIHIQPHISRVSSATRATFPNSRRAAASASRGKAPRSTRSRAAISRWPRISSSKSSYFDIPTPAAAR
jgi:hypothetical protein